MRIAYIAPYQGPQLVKDRPCLRNLSLGGNIKIELIAELLLKGGHDVEVLSQGEIIERSARIYPAFSEPAPFHPKIPVHYSSAFPVRFLNGMWSSLSTLRLFKARHRAAPFDAVLLYNLKPPQVACAEYAIKRLGLPVILEYEDDQFLELSEPGGTSFTSRYYLSKASRLLDSLSGCLSNSPSLLSQIKAKIPKLVLCGVVGEAILEASMRPIGERMNWAVFSGTHSKAQGLEQLITAWNTAKLPGWELHIAGHGAMTETLHRLAAKNSSIVFHGLLSRAENARMLGTGKITVVPYDVNQTLGFSFKTIECLAAGLHVITTPLVALDGLEPELKAGISYIEDNAPSTIITCLSRVIAERLYERTVAEATIERYGPAAVSRSLEAFLKRAASNANLNGAAGKTLVPG